MADTVSKEELDPYYEQIRRLPVKCSTTIRFFERESGLITVYDSDAELLAQKFFRSNGVVKKWGSRNVIYINLSLNNFESVLREALLSWHYRVELYVKESGGWVLLKKASPGNLTHFEDDLFGTETDSTANARSNDSMDSITSCFVSIRVVASSDSVGGGGGLTVGLAFVDVILRDISVVQFSDSVHLYQLETVLFRKGPKEAIVEKGTIDKCLAAVLQRSRILVSEVARNAFDISSLTQDLNTLLIPRKKQQPVSAASLPEMELDVACKALSGAIKHLDLVSQFGSQFKLGTLADLNYMRLDSSAIKALHLLPDPLEGVTRDKCLSGLLDKCRTGQGHRLLRQFLKHPLTDVRLIEERLDCVSVLVGNSDLRRQLHDHLLRRIPDVQRISARFQKNKASLKDVYKVYQGIEVLPNLISTIESSQLQEGSNESAFNEKFFQPLRDVALDLGKFVEMVPKVVHLEKVNEGVFMINPHFMEHLKDTHEEMEAMKGQMREALCQVGRKIDREPDKGVKLENHPNHGYCFKVTIKDDKLVRQWGDLKWLDSKKDGIRFTNDRMLKLSADYSAKASEYEEQQKEVVDKVLDVTKGYLEPLYRLSEVIAELDVLTGFAVFISTAKGTYVRPHILPGGRELRVSGLRHPCVEKEDNVYFIPNNLTLKRDLEEFILITGPNMGGKSTFIRSVGIVCLMAQVGCYVPCDEAHLSVVDAIMARIGAGDSIEKGVSTFMAEMVETNVILNTATENSLVIIDELGRGTSTFDGFGLAMAISEHILTRHHLHLLSYTSPPEENISILCYPYPFEKWCLGVSRIKPFALFATHFHELTALANKYDTVKNYHFTASVENNEVIMMYKMNPGYCDSSFGIHVAKMVKFPEDVLEEAERKAQELEWPPFSPEDDRIMHEFMQRVEAVAQADHEDHERTHLEGGHDLEQHKIDTIREMYQHLMQQHPNSQVAQLVRNMFCKA